MERIQLVSLRLVRERTVGYAPRTLGNSEAVGEMFRELVADLDRESLWVACLDTKNRVTCLSQISLGTLDSAPAHPREILKVALLANASAIILVHNHTSGDPQPSAEDRAVTRKVREAADVMGIRFLDHLIVGDQRHYSFADEGDL